MGSGNGAHEKLQGDGQRWMEPGDWAEMMERALMGTTRTEKAAGWDDA